MRLFSLLALSIAVFVSMNLTGCAPIPPPAAPHPKPQPGVNYYKKGWNDGCWTKRHVGVRKSQYLYHNFYSYRNGWHKGYNACKPMVKPLPGVVPGPVKPVPVIVPKPLPPKPGPVMPKPVAPKPLPPKPVPQPMPLPNPSI